MNELLKDVYQEFLTSPEWKKKREEILKRDDYTCQMCKCKERSRLRVHHTSYNFGWLNNEYLITLCDRCHSDVHSFVDRLKESKALKDAIKKAEEEYFKVIDSFVFERCVELGKSKNADLFFFTKNWTVRTRVGVYTKGLVKLGPYGLPYSYRFLADAYIPGASRYQAMRLRRGKYAVKEDNT